MCLHFSQPFQLSPSNVAQAALAMERSKQTIALERLKEIGKTTLKSPSPIFYQSEDLATVVTGHMDFFLAIAPHTKRLNPVSVSLVGKDFFQMEAGNPNCLVSPLELLTPTAWFQVLKPQQGRGSLHRSGQSTRPPAQTSCARRQRP